MADKRKKILLTGSTSGIGKVAAVELARQDVDLILPVRNLDKGEQLKKQIAESTGNTGIHIFECDLASFDSIRRFAGEFKKSFSHLDVLINNAGVLEKNRNETKDGIETTFAVNHLAPFLMTGLLTDELKAGAPSRIINVASEMHRYTKMNFDDPEGRKKFTGWLAYSQSKLANLLFTRYLSAKYSENEIASFALHPGSIGTGLYRKQNPLLKQLTSLLMKSPQKGIESVVYLATATDLNGLSGKYFIRKKTSRPSHYATNDKDAERLWELSRKYTGI
jgi:NAD(P)-dependent dehydrogenase (short-subunit alcohol dehydrogenase family)